MTTTMKKLSRIALAAAAAGALAFGLSGCVVAPIGPPGVVVRPGIYVAPPPPPPPVYYTPYPRWRRW